MTRYVMIKVECCEECPYHEGGSLGTPTRCNLTDTTFVSTNGKLIVPREWIETFPPDCPLNDVDDMSIYDYNFISEKIKNAKNIRDQRYG